MRLKGRLLCNKQDLGECSVNDVLARWQATLEDSVLAIPVMEPVASLLTHGDWCTLCLLGHWPMPAGCSLFPDFPPPGLSRYVIPEQDEAAASVALNSAKVAALAERIRGWAPLLLQTCADEEEQNNMRMELADTLGWFTSLEVASRQEGRQTRYSPKVLVSSVFLSALLGSRKKIASAIPLAVQVAMPGLDVEQFVSRSQFPKKTTIQRSGTSLDMAYLLVRREQLLASKHIFFALADSSPQAGRDWLMVMSATICEEDLVSAFRSSNLLIRSQQHLSDHHESLEAEIQDVIAASETVRKAAQHHTCVPTALGSSRGKAEDKAAAFLHSISLECESRSDLLQRMGDYFSWTTDLGTEVALPLFQVSSPESLLPEWLHHVPDPDVHQSDSESGAAGARAETEMQAQALLPRCLIVPGGMHITHNLTVDLRSKLTWWDTFWDHLQAVCKLLAERHLRERFVARCVRGTATAGEEVSINRAQVYRLYTKRWQIVIASVSQLLPVFSVLQQAWDEDRFLAGEQSDSDIAKSVTAALSCPLFSAYLHMVHGVH